MFSKIKKLFGSSKQKKEDEAPIEASKSPSVPPTETRVPQADPVVEAAYQQKDGMRSPAEIMDRVQCLLALVSRAQYENELSRQPKEPERIKSLIESMTHWIAEQGLGGTFSTNEKQLMALPPGSWTNEQILESHWRTESMSILLWVLQKLPEMPPFGIRILPEIYKSGLPKGGDENWGDGVSLRPLVQVEKMRELANLWHWRARTHYMQLQGAKPPEGDSYGATVSRAVEYARQSGLVFEPGGDLTLSGIPFKKLDRDAFAEAYASSLERHYAMNWLMDGIAWDDVTTDT